jgi:chromatin remodeling complex protein RSC6
MSIKSKPTSSQSNQMAKQASASTSSAPAVTSTSAASTSAAAKPKTPKPATPSSSAAVPAAAGSAVAAAAAKPKVVKAAKPAASAADAASPAADAGQNIVTAAVVESSLFAASHSKLQTLGSALAALRSELRVIERQVERELRAARKASEKKRRKNINRQPSGFVKPTLISNELAAFLGKSNGSEMARTEVTREINAYIRDNKLQDKDNGRRILPDAKLKKLLKLKEGDELTYFNLQRFMSPHFSTAAKSVAGAAVAAK